MTEESGVIDVTKHNFWEILPDFKKHLQECHFIAIDTEYSGLHESFSREFSLFDTPACRYKKMVSCPVRILQYGIALFQFNVDKNEWHSRCYKFLIFPVAFDSNIMTETIMCQASSLTFLRQHNFDFNRWIVEGIPFLNAQNARKVERYLKSRRSVFQNGSPVEKATLSTARWYQNNPNKASHMSNDDIAEIVDDLRGFSHIIEAISKSKKILVGHNAYIDLFLMYQEFCGSMPETYEQFKAQLTKLFPQIVDTKRLAHAIKDHLSATENLRDIPPYDLSLLNDTNLFALHFNTQVKEKFTPKLITNGDYKLVLELAAKRRIESIPDNLCHDAAFDACVTGCVFIQLAFLIQRPMLQFSSMHATARDQLYGCNQWFNMVNATRCTVPYINLQGDDPRTHRPSSILVVGHKRLDFGDQIERLHKNLPKFGDYDIKFQTDGSIIIACGSMGCYRGVRRYLSEEEFIVKDKSKIWNCLMQHTTCIKFCGAMVVTTAVIYWQLRNRA